VSAFTIVNRATPTSDWTPSASRLHLFFLTEQDTTSVSTQFFCSLNLVVEHTVWPNQRSFVLLSNVVSTGHDGLSTHRGPKAGWSHRSQPTYEHHPRPELKSSPIYRRVICQKPFPSSPYYIAVITCILFIRHVFSRSSWLSRIYRP